MSLVRVPIGKLGKLAEPSRIESTALGVSYIPTRWQGWANERCRPCPVAIARFPMPELTVGLSLISHAAKGLVRLVRHLIRVDRRDAERC